MTFLIDENLSWRLVDALSGQFPDCQHVLRCGLEQASDAEIWAHAKANNLALLSKDDDMRALVETHGPPPKLVWLRLGNVSTGEIITALAVRAGDIRRFLAGPETILELA